MVLFIFLSSPVHLERICRCCWALLWTREYILTLTACPSLDTPTSGKCVQQWQFARSAFGCFGLLSFLRPLGSDVSSLHFSCFDVFQVFQLVSAWRWSVGAALFLRRHQHYMRCVCEAWDFSALCFCFTSSLNHRSQIIHVVSRQGAAAASACGDSHSVCVCVRTSVSCILCKLGYCVRLCVMPACVCVCCNSHSKSKSLTAALMPAASQVMKGLLLVATDTSITPPNPSLLTANQSLHPLATLYPWHWHV